MPKVTTSIYGDLVFLPIVPSLGVSETLEWLTDLFTSHNGTEQALKLRQNARRTLRMKFFEDRTNKVPGFITEYGGLTGNWCIPLWFESQSLGAVSAGLSSIACTTDIFDFRDSSLALLYESVNSWQVVEIDSVTPSGLDLSTQTEGFGSAVLLPLRVGVLRGGVSRSSDGRSAFSAISLEVTDVLDPAEETPAQYLGHDIYFDEVFKPDGALYESTVDTETTRTDFDLGNFRNDHPWLYNRVSRKVLRPIESQQELYGFRQFLTRRSGRYRRFWEPSFVSDLRPLSSAFVSDQLLVSEDTLLDWTMSREHIAVLDSAGNWTAHSVDLAEETVAGVVRLTVTPNIDLEPADIDTVSFLGLKRLNTDSVRLSYPYGPVVVESVLETVEVSP
jgi:hypothetical protein